MNNKIPTKTISTVGKETLDAIALGLTTNATLGEYLDILPETVASRCARLRKQGILRATKPRNRNQPIVYTYTGADYVVSDAVITRNRTTIKPMKLYADAGEETFDNLNAFLYTRHYHY